MRNWHRNQRTRVPNNGRFRNLWRPREGRYQRPRLQVPRNQRARSEREDPEQQLYMSDDEPGLVEVTHEEDSSNPKARKHPEAKADMTGIDPLGKKKVTITFEPLWDKDGRCKDPPDYKRRLGEAHPVLTQGKEWKKIGCMDWCRANPGKERWIEGGSGYFRSNVTPAASYTGSKTDTEALTLHLKNQAKGGNYSNIAKLYCTGQVTITLHGYVCKVKTAAADQEEEEEEENDEQEEEGGELEEEEEEEDGESETDDGAGAPLATGLKRARSFDEGLEEHSDPNVRAKYADLRAAQMQEEEAHQAVNQRDSSLREALATFESTKQDVVDRFLHRPALATPASMDSYDGGSKSGLYFNIPCDVEEGACPVKEGVYHGKLGETWRGWEARAREHGNAEMGYENLHWVRDSTPCPTKEQEERFLKSAEGYALHLLTEQGYKRTGPTREDFTFPTAEERKTKTLEAMQTAMNFWREQRDQGAFDAE